MNKEGYLMETFISAPLALVIVGAISVMLLSFGFFVGKKVSKSSNARQKIRTAAG